MILQFSFLSDKFPSRKENQKYFPSACLILQNKISFLETTSVIKWNSFHQEIPLFVRKEVKVIDLKQCK